MSKFLKNYWALFIPLIILIIALIFLVKRPKAKEDNTVIGMVDADFLDVAAEFPGRLDSLMVKQGDTVKKGQLLGVLRTNEIDAIRNQTLSAIDAAKSQLALLQKGARPEVIKSAANVYSIAQEQYDLASKTYERMNNLYQKDVISGEEKDIIYFKLQAAKKEMETAKLNWDLLQKGTQPELIQAATAVLKQAEQGYELTKSLTDNTRVTAPADGIISTLVIHEGEIVSIGYPMITLQKHDSYFVRFNIRQDKIKGLQQNSRVQIKIPGAKPETFDAVVSRIAPSLEFANWVPTKDRGQFELRTFTIECKPANVASIKDLRPGMTASMQLP